MRTHATAVYHHTPPSAYRHMFHSAVQAGRRRMAAGPPLGTWPHPSHHLILPTMGSLPMQVGNRAITVGPGEFAWIWIDGKQRREVSWPARPGPCDVYWMRLEPGHIGMFAEALDVAGNPIFTLPKNAKVLSLYRTAFKLMHTRPVGVDAALHAVVAALLAILFEVRLSVSVERRVARGDAGRSDGITKVLDTMRTDYKRRWKVQELAQLMGLSRQQFFRRFHQATGSSPMDWLRRERINQAKQLLTETGNRVDQVAESVGYRDPYYFSRDFKKVAGMSPRRYRLWEREIM